MKIDPDANGGKNRAVGSTFLTFNDKTGYWMRDGHLTLWCRLLALHLEESDDARTMAVVYEIRNQWLRATSKRHQVTGSIGYYSTAIFGNAEAVRLIARANQSLMSSVRRTRESLGPDAFNLLGLEGEQVGDTPREDLLEIGQAFADLINGKPGLLPSDTSFMPGCSSYTKSSSTTSPSLPGGG